MSLKKMLTALTLSLILLMAWGCSQRDSQIVAKVGDWTLTKEEFKDMALRRWGSPEKAAQKSKEDIENLLDDMVVNQLKTMDGYNKGLDNDPEAKANYQKAVDRGAITKLYKDEIRDKLITEQDIEDFYDHYKEELHASHVLLRIDEGETEESVKKQIESIRNEALKPDASFSEIAKKYTEDKSSPDGDLDWFEWGTMVEPFQTVVWQLKPGEISEPVKTDYGWHIIKLHGRRAKESQETLEEAREKIIGLISRQRQKELSDFAMQYIENLKKERSYTYNDKNISEIISTLGKRTMSGDPLSLLSEEQQNLTVVELDGGKQVITIKELLERAKKMGPSSKIVETDESLKGFAERFATEEILLPDQARKVGCYNDPDIEKPAKEALDRKVRQLAQNAMVTERSEPTDEEAAKYFEKNSNSYMTDAQFTLLEILQSDEKKAKELADRIQKGENMRELAMTYSERNRAKEKEGILGPIKANQHGEIGKAAAKAELGQLVGPIFLKSTKKWSLFKVISKEDPHPQDYEKVERKVKSDLRLENKKRLEEEWVKEIKKSISHTVNYAALRNLFAGVKVEEPAQ